MWSERVFSQIHHQNAFTETAWEDAEQGLGMAMSTLASEKKQGIVVYWQNVFAKSDISGYCFTSISRVRPPENRKF